MPEPNFVSLYSLTPEPPKKSPIIKLSGGIGDTDGFPAFDVDSEAYATKDDSKWGFLITGGAEFHMPLTVFQVTPDGLADQGGICLGDIILEINEEDATNLTLSQAHEKIEAKAKKILFLVKSMDDEEPIEGYEPGEERCIVLRVPKPLPPPKEFTPTPLLGSRCWHPIMWYEPPPPPKPKKKKTKTEIDEEGNEVIIELSEDESSDEEEEELPHHRILANIKRFFAENKDKDLRARITEDMLLALPSASISSIEKRLEELQRKLSEIAEIPKILSSTLATVTQTFDKLTTNMPPTTCQHLVQGENEYYHHLYANEQKRKLSYDEDVYDYELSDDNDDAGENGNLVEGANDKMKMEQFDAKVAYLQLKRYAARQRKSKEVTPESDYASENNYPQSDAEDETDKEENVDDDDDDNNICDIYEQFNLSVNKSPLGHATKHEGDVDEDDDNMEDNDDFLTTTFTWNLRNKPKLQVNGRDNDDDINTHEFDEDDNSIKQQKSFYDEDDTNHRQVKDESPEKQHKLDKLERCWPWADREKIIYKQSTCHLVPHKPLGLIGQRIQLLAKRNLLEHLNNNKNPQ